MNTHSLMYGNRLMLGDDGMIKLNEVACTFQELFDIEQGHIRAFPIPITEKVLAERFGFVKKGDVHIESATKGTVIITKMYYTGDDSHGWVLHYNGNMHKISFMHELQNVWLFLFGEPIKIDKK